ncbi:YihY/virulence factor BrkB family protein [Cellulomonas sp. URHB0016]
MSAGAAPRPEEQVAGPAVGEGAAHVRAAAAAPDPPAEHPAEHPAETGPSLVDRAKALLEWWKHSRPGRANARFGARGGGLLTGGIAYAALFSVFAGLTIGYTVFMAVLGGNEELRDKILDSLAASLPGLLDTGDGTGLVDPEVLVLSPALTAAGVVALVVLVLSALSATAALRTGVRAMFGVVGGENAVVGKLRALVGFVGMAMAVLVSAVLTTAVGAAVQWLLQVVGWTGASGFTVRMVGIVVTFVVDVGTFLLVVKVLAGKDPAWRDLWRGSFIAATGIGVVRILGTSVVAGSATRNPLLASFSVIVTLLVWINLIARIVLLAAAWTADPPYEEPAGADPTPAGDAVQRRA